VTRACSVVEGVLDVVGRFVDYVLESDDDWRIVE
jgi:hypothetical protein